jgi:hypothetical protein
MIDLISNKRSYLILIIIHLAMGSLLSSMPQLITYVYLGFFGLFIFDVVFTSDRDNRAGAYALYMMGLELLYRMAGATFSYEFGKYACILILLVGLIVSRRKTFAWTYVFLLFLLIPAAFLITDPNPVRVRKMLLFNLSGPLSLILAGLYFYKLSVPQAAYYKILRFAFLPAFSLAVGLHLVSNVAVLQFTSLESSAEASGHFGANQVSTVLGWFTLLILLFKVNGKNLTPWGWLDWVMVFYLFLRALLTFSRGGVLGSILPLIAAVGVLFFYYSSFRHRMIRAFPYMLVGVVFLVGVVVYANNLTNNYLFYRYQGKSGFELRTGITDDNKSYLTGRDKIMKAEMKAFEDYPILGAGIGMAHVYRERYYGDIPSHTEYSRLVSEHGILGVLFMLIGLIGMPIYFFFSHKDPLTRFFFVAFYLLSMLTMFHAAMRLALPGVVFGAAFMQVISEKNQKEKFKEALISNEEVKTI